MRALAFVALRYFAAGCFAAGCCAGNLFAGPPDGYLTGATCGLAEPVGAGVSLPLARTVPTDLKIEEVEQRIGAWLDRRLHYPDQVRVHCTRNVGWNAGHFDEISVEFKGGSLDFVPVAIGRIRLAPVQIDLTRLWAEGEVDIGGTSPADAHLEVDERGLNDVMVKKAGDLNVERPHISLLDGSVRFGARMRTILIKNDVVTQGRFELAAGKLNFLPSALKVGFIPLPSSAVNALARRFNPILDVSSIHPVKGISFALERVIVQPGKMVLETAKGDTIAQAR